MDEPLPAVATYQIFDRPPAAATAALADDAENACLAPVVANAAAITLVDTSS
jgi:hypothetical protein